MKWFHWLFAALFACLFLLRPAAAQSPAAEYDTAASRAGFRDWVTSASPRAILRLSPLKSRLTLQLPSGTPSWAVDCALDTAAGAIPTPAYLRKTATEPDGVYAGLLYRNLGQSAGLAERHLRVDLAALRRALGLPGQAPLILSVRVEDGDLTAGPAPSAQVRLDGDLYSFYRADPKQLPILDVRYGKPARGAVGILLSSLLWWLFPFGPYLLLRRRLLAGDPAEPASRRRIYERWVRNVSIAGVGGAVLTEFAVGLSAAAWLASPLGTIGRTGWIFLWYWHRVVAALCAGDPAAAERAGRPAWRQAGGTLGLMAIVGAVLLATQVPLGTVSGSPLAGFSRTMGGILALVGLAGGIWLWLTSRKLSRLQESDAKNETPAIGWDAPGIVQAIERRVDEVRKTRSGESPETPVPTTLRPEVRQYVEATLAVARKLDPESLAAYEVASLLVTQGSRRPKRFFLREWLLYCALLLGLGVLAILFPAGPWLLVAFISFWLPGLSTLRGSRTLERRMAEADYRVAQALGTAEPLVQALEAFSRVELQVDGLAGAKTLNVHAQRLRTLERRLRREGLGTVGPQPALSGNQGDRADVPCPGERAE